MRFCQLANSGVTPLGVGATPQPSDMGLSCNVDSPFVLFSASTATLSELKSAKETSPISLFIDLIAFQGILLYPNTPSRDAS